MTIRDYLWKRNLVRLFIIFVSAAAIFFINLELQKSDNRYTIAIFSLLGFSLVYGLSAYLVNCPNCSFSFLFGNTIRLYKSLKKYRFNYWPHCGVALDSEYTNRKQMKV
ncbi:hypothetical protein [Permianibacter aggregans]|uniref:Uncharacterized protein n=1 Tax=Permianibacter aggregans TaxID=1510150 RepID=A0A4V3D752_9GAMM|nr:hypothetical protein [Permianibacter aggregans]QGX40613.1 hypothetical protein E2H98_13415 [Permianibacter aggregans]TDQ46477.1 hypothetical protein EV696_11318 [Permianibacter aggregans]